MANTTRYVNLNTTTNEATFSNKGKLTMNYNDTLTIDLATTNWPSDAKIEKVRFYGGQDGTKDPTDDRGTWDRSKPTVQPSNGEVTVGISGKKGVIITNADTKTDEDEMWYEIDVHSVSGHNGKHDWTPDPELILKKKVAGASSAGA